MKITEKRFLLVMHCEARAEIANKRRGAGSDDAVFGLEYQCCGADGVVRWVGTKKLPDTHYSLSGRSVLTSVGILFF